MTGPIAILVAMTLDPLRIVLVALAMWLVSKLYDKGERAMPLAIALVVCSAIMTIAIMATRYVPGDWIVPFFFGLIACYLIAAIIHGLVTGAKRLRS